MCITFFRFKSLTSKNQQHFVKFALAFNRDEQYDRKSQPMTFHPKFASIICGIDIQTGTTWLAVNKETGDLAMLTNFRTKSNYESKKYVTRGNLILEYVKIRDKSIKDSDKLYKSIEEYEKNSFGLLYRGFNLVYGNIKTGQLKYYQFKNSGDEQCKSPIELQKDRIYGMSNGGIDLWDKVERGKAKFKNILDQADKDYNDWIQDGLNPYQFMTGLGGDIMSQIMRDDTKSLDAKVQTTDHRWMYEKLLSSIFLRNNYFNHCCVSTTVLIVDNQDRCLIFEDSYKYQDSYFQKLANLSHTLGVQDCCGGAFKPQFQLIQGKKINFEAQI